MLEKNTNLDYLRRIRQETQDKWEKLGFLDGLKGMIKPEIAELFECCKSTLTNEKKEVMNEIEVKKDLYKSKAMAKLSHYQNGNLYYRVELNDGIYQFPIATVEDVIKEVELEIKSTSTNLSGEKTIKQKNPINFSFSQKQLTEDLGDTAFDAEIKGSELIRWIGKAIKNETFFKVSSKPVTENGEIIGYQG